MRRAGVVVALPIVVDPETLFSVCAAAAPASDRFSRGDASVSAVFGFDAATGEEAAIAVSQIGSSAVANRPEIAKVLRFDVVDAVRIDGYTQEADGSLAVRTEIALLRISRDIAAAFGGLVCDDVGAIYDPQELEMLVAAGRPRALSFAFELACAERAASTADDTPDIGSDWPTLGDAKWPSECVPDIALDVASILIVFGRHVSITTAARIAVLLSVSDVPPVVLFAPNLDERDARVMRAAGVFVSSTLDALQGTLGIALEGRTPQRLIADTVFTRDEIVLFSATEIRVAEIRAFVDRRGLEMATMVAQDGDAAQPAIVRIEGEHARQPLPVRLARFAFTGVVVDAYHLDIEEAHPLLRALIAQRVVVRELLAAPVRSVVVLESIGTSLRSHDADAFSVSLLAELASETSVAQDDAGAIFDARSLLRLALARAGREQCWQERVALASFEQMVASA